MGDGKDQVENPEVSRRLKRFTLVVTVGLIIGCNALILTGLWVSGVDLEKIVSKSELFDPENGHCVQVTWLKVVGADGLVKVCTEWLDFSDISGDTHRLPEGETLAMGPDGNLYVPGNSAENYRLIALMIFAIVVIISGMWTRQMLIAKYQDRFQYVNHHST